MKRLPRADVAIVGGGWSGLLMAKELGARTGLSVVVLERGAPRKSTDYFEGMDELDYAIRLRMMQDASKETVTFRHTSKDKALPIRQFANFLPGTGVGGAGEHWNGITPRFLPDCFELLTRTVERYGAGKLPANHALQDWGITYAELEPFYTRAERLLGISGQRGLDPFEGPHSAEYPTPPQKTPYFPSLFREAARSLGYHPFPAPSANLSQAYRTPDGIVRPACEYCGFCERYGCMVGAKAQPTNTLLPVIARQKSVTVRTGANVRRVLYKDGKATGVSYVDANGEETEQPADLVVLASWTLNNTRLLMLSRIGDAYDAASGKGQVGRNLTHQAVSRGVVLFFDRPLNRFMGSGACGIVIRDLDGDNFDHGPLNFLRGAYAAAFARGNPPIGAFGVVPSSVKGTWGSEWKKAAIDAFDCTASFGISGEHLAYRSNYMDLDPTYRDSNGDPLLRMTMDWNDNERNIIDFVSAKMAQVGRAMGAREVLAPPLPRRYDVNTYRSTHLQGGTIMGANPANSVVNPWLQHWQVPNLFVLGASTFPQNPSGNPTLTILAQTLRTADAVIDRYLKRPGVLA
uniref:Glucose-methanol-choline oxidoreductase n=1 Tax=Solibacter usitatus (strain Ellin6076) TaxID=234267 RepID=Q01UH3_SOLUE